MASTTEKRHWNCIIAYNALGGYAVPVSSSARNCSQHILNGRVFEPRMPDFIAKHVGTGDIVHAGTFFGDFLPAFSRALAPGAKVWAFEPVAENHACAKLTLEMNRIDNVVLALAGLGEGASKGVMVTVDPSGMALGEIAYIAHGAPESSLGTESIQIVSIDDTVPVDRHVSIIQLDVEGFEEQSLNGAMATIRRCKPILVLELLPSPAWVAKHLTPLGYRVREGVHANVVLSVTPTGTLKDALRWRARSVLKAIIPMRIRRRMRERQATHRHSADGLPTARDSGALDCVLVSNAEGDLICAPPKADLTPAATMHLTASGELLLQKVNYGQDIPRLAKAGKPVFAVEADPDKRRYARMTAILNRLELVQVEASVDMFKQARQQLS